MNKLDDVESIKDGLDFMTSSSLNKEIYYDESKVQTAKRLFSSKDISFDEKKILLNLLMDYKRKFKNDSDISVKDVILLENNVYEKVDIYDDGSKVVFELERIKLNILGRKNVSQDILNDYQMLVKVGEIYFSDNLMKKEEVLKNIFESVVLLELKLGMKIALYETIFNLFNKKYEYYMNREKYNIDDVDVEESVNIRRK